MSDLLDAALEWASAGFKVFPCHEGAKTPACPHGIKDATDNPELIRKLWTDGSGVIRNYNVAVAPAKSGCYVLDVDGPLGAETLARLESAAQPLPSTLTVQTPRGPGHRHYWFSGSAPSTVAKLGAKLDTRGEGGYILVPPSRTAQGNYDYIGDTNEIADAPAWIGEKLSASREGHEAPADLRVDNPANIARACAYLQALEPTSQGNGADHRTFQAAAGVRDFGISAETTLALMKEHYKCQPQDERYEAFLMRKIGSAFTYAQNEAGAYAAPDPVDEFKHYVGISANSAEKPTRKRFYPMDESEMALLPEPAWLLKDLIPAKSLVLAVGAFDSYKSFLALDIGLTLASGIAGWDCDAREPACVLYAPSEGMHEIARRRKPAWKLARGIEDHNIPFYMVEDVPWLKFENDLRDFIGGVTERKIVPKLVIVDTVASAMLGLDENNAHDIGLFVQAAKSIKQAFGCTVLAVHHLGKDKERGSRGSSALPAGFDTVLSIEAQHATRTVQVQVQKQKDAERRKVPYLFQGALVGQSLVFSPITAAQYRTQSTAGGSLGHAAVAGALRSCGALSELQAVTTRVLATVLCPQTDSDTHETYDRAVKGFEKELRFLASGKLAAFVLGEGKSLRWFIPAQASEKAEEF